MTVSQISTSGDPTGGHRSTPPWELDLALWPAPVGPSWLDEHRRVGRSLFATLSPPTESEEVWRYSGIDKFDVEVFAAEPAGGAPDPETDWLRLGREASAGLGSSSALVVTSGGKVVATEIGTQMPGFVVQHAADSELEPGTDRESEVGSFSWYGELAEVDDSFGALHDALVPDVISVQADSGVEVADPVIVVHLIGASAQDAPGVDCPHLLIRVADRGRVGVIELLVADPSGSRSVAPSEGDVRSQGRLVLPVVEIDVEDNARVDYANVQLLPERCTQIGLQASRVAASGEFRSFTVALGGGYARVRTESKLVGDGARASLLAAYLGVGGQVLDFRTLQEHRAPRTESELLFEGAVADTARSVYSGMIRIQRGARRSVALQTNRNLVLSVGAEADSVPNLDILENDVKCSHASAVGPVDEEQLWYLESRGIDPATAERMIVLGFFADLAQRAPWKEVGDWVEKTVVETLTGRLVPTDATATATATATAPTGGATEVSISDPERGVDADG